MIRTIEDLLGLKPLGMFDANAQPMDEVFNAEPDLTPYKAVLPGSLCKSPVDPKLIPECKNGSVLKTAAIEPLHDGSWWAAATKDFDFRRPDALNSEAFNRVLWEGVMGDKPYPETRSGRDLTKLRVSRILH